jgi:hypothetical protein
MIDSDYLHNAAIRAATRATWSFTGLLHVRSGCSPRPSTTTAGSWWREHLMQHRANTHRQAALSPDAADAHSW